MYLSKFVKTIDGNKFPMASILPFATEMLTKRKMLGYITTSFENDCFFGQKGDQLRGHEFLLTNYRRKFRKLAESL